MNPDFYFFLFFPSSVPAAAPPARSMVIPGRSTLETSPVLAALLPVTVVPAVLLSDGF
mgnify:CR=1 FL=1